MKRKFGNLLMAATLVLAVGVFFTSCRDHDEELIAVIDAQSQTLEELNEQLATDKSDLEDAIGEVLGTVDDEIVGLNDLINTLSARVDSLASLDHSDCDHTCDHSGLATKEELADSIASVKEMLKNAIDDLAAKMATKDALKEVSDSLSALKGDFASHVELFNELSSTVTDAVARLSTLEGNYEKLDARVKAIEDAKYQDQIDAIRGELQDVLELANIADARSKADSVRIDVLQANVDSLEAFDLEISQALKDSIAAVRAEAVANLTEAKEHADAVAAAVAKDLAETNATVATLQDAFKNAVAELQDQIDVLQEELDELVDEVDAVNERVDELVEVIDEIKEYLNKQITSVSVHGAYSPVIGYFSLPTGVKSNILAAYYGVADADFYFPTVRTANNVGAAFDEEAFEALGFAEELTEAGVLIAGKGNAGKVYLTVNPAEVEVTADQFALVNSLGEESPAKITNLKVSEDKLAFGYTRDGAVALYEAEATIAAEDVENAKLRIELSDLKDALKDVVTVKDGVNVTDVVTTLYSLVNDIADAHAVQATWTDAEGVGHTLYSSYDLATVAVKPLSYSFLADLNVSSIPGYHKGMNLVNKVFDKVGYVNIPDLGLSSLSAKLEAINFGGAIGDSISFKVTQSVPVPIKLEVDAPLKDYTYTKNVEVKDKLGAVIGTVDIEVPIKASDIVDGKITIDTTLYATIDIPVSIPTKDVLGDLGGTLEGLDDLLAQVNAMIESVDGKVEVVESLVNVAKDKVQSGLNKALDKINNKLCAMVNSFNNVLQPTMLVSTTDGFSMLSSIKGAPTTIDKASAVLVPTSFTAEILAPACKKFVAVTNAYDANGKEDLAAAKAANAGDLATVLPGETRTVQFNGKVGYTYELTYSAVDFYGMISNTKYYVRVK